MSALERLPGDTTSISWVLAVARAQGKRAAVWNPQEGCEPAGEGCRNCWAAREVHMHGCQKSERMQARFADLTRKTANGRIVFNGVHREIEDDISKPFRTKAPTVFFVGSRSDLFRDEVPTKFIHEIITNAYCFPQHTYLFLTKWPERMRITLSWRHSASPFPGHFWLGTSVWDQASADARIPELRDLPTTTFVSYEPAIGLIDFQNCLGGKAISWLIVGAESGPRARPMHPDWPRQVRDQCQAAGAAFFYKQARNAAGRMVHMPLLGGQAWAQVPGGGERVNDPEDRS